MKLKVIKEGRDEIYIPEKESLKEFIKARGLKKIHNFIPYFIPSGMMMLGCNHDVKGVLEDIDRADRLGVLTNKNANMGHSLSLIYKEKLECYDIGEIKESDLLIKEV